MDLKSLVDTMKGQSSPEEGEENKPKKKSIAEAAMESFPSDEKLQRVKEERRGWIGKLKEKGLPEPIAKGAEWLSDTITPDTREEYMGQMIPAVGSVGKVGGGLGRAAISNEGKTALRKMARSLPAAKGAAVEASDEALESMANNLAKEGTFVKQGQLQRQADINKLKLKNEVRSNPTESSGLNFKEINKIEQAPDLAPETYKKIGPGDITPGVKELQDKLAEASSKGDYRGAKAIQEQIRKLRGGK